MSSALVHEVVHLFRDDVGGVTNPLKDAEIFEERRDHLAVTGRFDDLGEGFGEASPSCRFRSQHIAHAGTGLEGEHEGQG